MNLYLIGILAAVLAVVVGALWMRGRLQRQRDTPRDAAEVFGFEAGASLGDNVANDTRCMLLPKTARRGTAGI